MIQSTTVRRSVTIPKRQGQWSMTINVGDFDPEDIVVKTVNKFVEISAEKWGNGAVQANFTHRCQLPAYVDATTVSSQLYQDGTLVLRACPSA
uniref:SHSP domain-containing protein n=1 Tax=Ciona savignyi TaxID=51511 RepID=H2YVM6_CIOSA